MKKEEYKLKQKVWIHLGEKNLVEGRVVEIIDLVHLKEGHSEDNELYVIEIKTGIDDVYEVRTWEQISTTAKGPINLFKQNISEIQSAQRILKKIGIPIPTGIQDLDDDLPDPTPEEIHAAMDRAEQANKNTFTVETATPKKRNYYPRGKNAKRPRRPAV